MRVRGDDNCILKISLCRVEWAEVWRGQGVKAGRQVCLNAVVQAGDHSGMDWGALSADGEM